MKWEWADAYPQLRDTMPFEEACSLIGFDANSKLLCKHRQAYMQRTCKSSDYRNTDVSFFLRNLLYLILLSI